MAISQTITAFPAAPNAGSDTPEEFSNKADAFVAHQSDNYVGEVNTWATEANATAQAINDTVATLPDGSINDTTASDTSTYSSNKLEDEYLITSIANWTRFPDGTMIMTGEAVGQSRLSFDAIFQGQGGVGTAFISAPIMSVTPLNYTADPGVDRIASTYLVTQYGADIKVATISGTASALSAQWTAIGRWK